MSRILVLSNGHGEDLSGSFLSRRLVDNGNIVDALPIVGNGNNYIKQGISIIGKTKEFKTGGLGYNSFKGRISDLLNGQIIYFIKKLLLAIKIRRKYDYYFIVGDIVPLFFAWLAQKKSFVYLVAYSSHYEGNLKLPWPCKYFLASKNIKKIYSRDLFTANDLRLQLNKEVKFLGNPFMDQFDIKPNKLRNFSKNIALLPGSRIPELINNFSLMLELLDNLASYKYFQDFTFNFALINQFKRQEAIQILNFRGWQKHGEDFSSKSIKFKYKDININLKWNSFSEILNDSDLVISMAGTATEQAIGLAKPVVQIIGFGPQFTKAFADAQRRLLGKHIYCVTRYLNKTEQIEETIKLIIKSIYLIKIDEKFLISCEENANARIGKIGATNKIIADIFNY